MSTQGVMLICFGKRGYSYAAYNLALSIKYYNHKINITLYHDDQTLTHISNHDVFDQKILLSDDQIYRDGVIDPCYIKTHLYDFCPYDQTLYLDVDALCFKDLQPLFDELKDCNYMVDVYDSHTIDKGRDFPSMIWAWCDDIWKHFNLNQDSILPATNSSIQFFRKGLECEKLWLQVDENYRNKIPLEKLRTNWGGTQPDELYLNVAMAQLGWKQYPRYIFLGDKHSKLSLLEIESQFYILSIYGGRGYTKLVYIEWYERLCQRKFKTPYKVQNIIADKHCNTKNKERRGNFKIKKFSPEVLEKGIISIENTSLIQKADLLLSYPDPKGKQIRVTNHLNCSFIKFKGKIIFVYRMESMPWCSFTKLGICFMNESEGNYFPVKESNKVLNLHSALHGYAKGYHVEDPRLFVYNDELYLSYCDGYQMAQAKINHETLEASESFYIDKPLKSRTEKNWTFFQHKNNLYSVYSINPHIVFKMNGSNFEKQFETRFTSQWKWGELRGGTSPILTRDGYLSFFHSSLDMQNNGRQYFVGAYMFDKEPPFSVIAISEKPLLAGEYISESVPRLSSKIFVVFPGGVIEDGNGYNISFGYNDYQARYVHVSRETLKNNLIELNKVVEA